MADAPLATVVDDLLAKMRGPMGLGPWQIKTVVQPGDETAACAAEPEYRRATIYVDPDRLQTGDELDETVAHELTHALIWPLANAADDLRIAVGELVPEAHRPALNRYIEEQNRRAEEEAATLTGRAFTTLFRCLWAAEAALAEAEKEIRALRRAQKGLTT